ncbi:MAG: MOSC domain-containing protein [Pseudomonadota bacterium]
MSGRVLAVCLSPAHDFSKTPQPSIRIIAGLGVDGDAHKGVTVKHRSRVAKDPSRPNLRQVHLLNKEIVDHVAALGFPLEPGQIGENILTEGIDLLALPRGTVLTIGEARMEVTGLRNPCWQLDHFKPGLRRAFMPKGADGEVRRLAGVMAIALSDGEIRPGDAINAALPPEPHEALTRV